MGKQIKLPNIDFVKVGNTLVESGKTAGAFVKNHATEFLAGALAGVTIDNIRIRMGRKKENAHKQQQVIRKHEAEINVLKDKAEQGQEALQKVDQLEQIVNNLTEGGASE